MSTITDITLPLAFQAWTPQLQLTAEDEYLLELDNGYGLAMWPQLGTPDRWEVEILTMGMFGGTPAPASLIGRWPWELSGLDRDGVETVQGEVARLRPGATPKAMRRKRIRRAKGSAA